MANRSQRNTMQNEHTFWKWASGVLLGPVGTEWLALWNQVTMYPNCPLWTRSWQKHNVIKLDEPSAIFKKWKWYIQDWAWELLEGTYNIHEHMTHHRFTSVPLSDYLYEHIEIPYKQLREKEKAELGLQYVPSICGHNWNGKQQNYTSASHRGGF